MKSRLVQTTRAWVVTTTLVLCGTALAADPIKIGWISSLTGALSSAALAENQGVQLAVDEINKNGGILGRQIELLTRDTAGDPTKAVNFAQQLAFSDKVNVVIGPVNSGEGLAVASRMIVRTLRKQMRVRSVPVFHGPHRGFTLERRLG